MVRPESNSNTRLLTRAMFWRSVATSLVVGSVLFAINHEPTELAGDWTGAMWRQLGLSMLVPFAVSLTSAAMTRREILASGWTLRPARDSRSGR